MIYSGPGFVALVRFGSSRTPSSPLPSASWLSFSISLCSAGRAYWRESGRGWARSQIIRPRERLALYNTLIYSTLFPPYAHLYWQVCHSHKPGAKGLTGCTITSGIAYHPHPLPPTFKHINHTSPTLPVREKKTVLYKRTSVVDPDPGSGAFLTPGSGIRDG